MHETSVRHWIGLSVVSLMWAAPAIAADGASGEIDLLELHLGGSPANLMVQSTWSLGPDKNQFVLKFDTDGDIRAAFDDAVAHALYARAVSPSITILGGLRHDFRAGRDRDYAAIGAQAQILPWLEGEHYLYLARNGDLAGSWQLRAQWDPAPRFTVEPRVTGNWSARAIPNQSLGSGLTDVELSVRLRHRITEHANIYLGAIQERLLGDTRRIAESRGERGVANRLVIGAGMNF